MLAGSVDTANAGAVDRVLQAIDRSLQTLAPAVKNRQLLGLLEFPATRRLLAGVWASWENATLAEIRAFLDAWGRSNFNLFNGAAAGLTALIKAAWFGLPESFAAIHYPGPPAFAVKELLGGEA